jgi:hypothetical protein
MLFELKKLINMKCEYICEVVHLKCEYTYEVVHLKCEYTLFGS